MPRLLTDEQESVLGTAGRRTTLEITLGDGTPLLFSTTQTDIDDKSFLGKLQVDGELNLDAGAGADVVNLKISAVYPELRQNLINSTDVLSNASAILGTYFEGEGVEFLDEKLQGKITVGEINGNWISISFESTVSSKIYNGVTISLLFPDSEIPATELPPPATVPPAPVYDDTVNVPIGGVGRIIAPILDDRQYANREYLPLAILNY